MEPEIHTLQLLRVVVLAIFVAVAQALHRESSWLVAVAVAEAPESLETAEHPMAGMQRHLHKTA